jgi:hypothetical protein
LDPCAEAGSAKSIAPLVVVVDDVSVGPPTPPIPTPLPCSLSTAATCDDRVAFDLATARWCRSGSALRKKRC